MFGLGPAEIAVIGVVVVLIAGPSMIPRLARNLATGIKEFKNVRKELTAGTEDVQSAVGEARKEAQALGTAIERELKTP